jgi:probable HAF family extracellular repeat protein
LGLTLTGAVSAQEYEVTDIGAIGDTNVAWSINQLGDIAGFSRFYADDNIEGFVYCDGDLDYVGFVQGGASSNVVAMNNLGQGIGSSGSPYDDWRAFIWTGSHKVNLGTLGGDRSWGHGLNDLGQAVGTSKLADNYSTRAFIWEDGEMRALPTLGGEHGEGRWINNNGQIVGSASDDPGSLTQYSVLWESGEIFRLPPHDGYHHNAWFIHDNGDIAGLVRFSQGGFSHTRAAIWRDREVALQLGTLADGTPFENFASSNASAINAAGVIVGMSINATGDAYVPFVYRDGEMVQLDHLMPAPWVALNVGPGSINDAGQIAVEAKIPGEPGSHALLLTPIVSCHADIDGSGDVSISDLLALLAAWGPCPGCPEDLDGDGNVGIVDLLELLASWGPCP